MTLNLNCANFYDEKGKSPAFPPEGLKKHPQEVDKESIRKAIEKGEETLVIVANVTDTKALAKKAANKKVANKKAETKAAEQEKVN